MHWDLMIRKFALLFQNKLKEQTEHEEQTNSEHEEQTKSKLEEQTEHKHEMQTKITYEEQVFRKIKIRFNGYRFTPGATSLYCTNMALEALKLLVIVQLNLPRSTTSGNLLICLLQMQMMIYKHNWYAQYFLM